MDAPQSPDEVAPVVAELRRTIDARLDIRWHPTAVMETRGGYDGAGRIINPVYAGRWEVVCYESAAQTTTWRPYQRVCLLTAPAPDSVRGVPALLHEGPYAPVGSWVVTFLQAVDQANAADIRRMRAALDAEEARNDAAEATRLTEATTEAAGKVWDNAHREAGVAVFHPVTVDLRDAHDTNATLTPTLETV